MSRTADEFLERHPELLEEDMHSPRAVATIAALGAVLERYFRFTIDGWEHVPDGPVMVVANHNSAAPHEILLLLRAWYGRFRDRPARGMLHRVAWQPPLRWLPIFQWVGGIFAHPEVAKRALGRGDALLVFPGGDLEALRPFAERYKVSFGGRTGFARIAQQTGVPVVPLVLCGSHAPFFMLPGTQQLGDLLRMRSLFGVKRFPLSLGLLSTAAAAGLTLMRPRRWPLLAASALQMALPLPSRIQARFLPPLTLGENETPQQAAERVRATMQEAMDEMAAERRSPWG